MRLLVTRPEPEGERTARRLRAMGFEALLTPVMRIVPLDAPIQAQGCTALAVTSAHALDSLRQAPELLALPLYAVGEQTASMARALGFQDVDQAGGTARDLAARLASLPAGSVVYHPHGRDRREKLEELLASAPVRMQTQIVYEALAVETLADGVVEALQAGQVAGVLHYSLRSAELLLRLCAKAGCRDKVLALQQFCLSGVIAEALRNQAARHVFVAERPDENALLACVMSCSKRQ